MRIHPAWHLVWVITLIYHQIWRHKKILYKLVLVITKTKERKMQPVSINVSPEFLALGTALSGLIADIKAGKTVIQDAEDAFASLVTAVGGFEKIGTDVQYGGNVAYLVNQLMTALVPAPSTAQS